ncbi:MAG: beta-galactosidase, partial [Candidatus Omnitrophica bacterium]|nr:beta-galactosidase [Candidatus Omnitrophota bacterium]
LVAKMDKETSAYRSSENIKGIMTIENKKERKKIKLDIEVEDSSGRIVYRQTKETELNTGKNEIPVEISKEKMIDIYHDLKVSVIDGNAVVSRDRHIFFVYPERLPLYDDFYLACWGNLDPNPLKIIISGRKLKEAGIDYVYSYGEGKSERYVAYKTGHLLMGPPFSCSLKGGYAGNRKADTAKLTYDPPLVPSEQELNQFMERMRNMAKAYSDWAGVDYIHLDDERDMQNDFHWSERTIEKFRQGLKDTYGTIEKLNKQWDASYKDWNEVMPVKITEIKDKNNISQYIDWRTFIGWAIMEYYYKVPAEAAKQGNPRAVVGQHGIYQTSLTIPHDFWEMSKYTPVTGRYNGMIEEWFSSFGVISGQYGGYGVDVATPGHRYHPWRSLLHGGHWAFYYILWNSGTYHQGILSPDQSVHGGYNELSKEEFSDIKNGIGKLFIETNFSSDGICFPYSYSSILAAQALGMSRTGNLYSQKTLIQNLGYQHRFLSYQQIKDGELIKKGFKVLILPETICLSTEEIAAIKEFVKQGGTLIADHLPGVRDQHGKLYGKKGPLDEIFGIDRSNAEFTKIKKKMRLLKSNLFDEKEIEMTVAEQGIKTGSGKNMAVFEDGTPALIINDYGKGKGIYLNLDISDYAGMKGRGVAGEVIEEEKGISDYVGLIQEIFGKILANTGMKKRLEILDGEKPINDGERFYYVDGNNTYVGYLPEVKSEKKVTIKASGKAHIYDLRTQKYIGFTDTFTDTLKPGAVKVYSMLPYRVTAIQSSIKSQYKQGENISLALSVNTEGKTAGKHIFRIEVYKDGKNVQCYNRNIAGEKGSATTVIPLSYNEEKGNYTLVVRDVNTGTSASFKFKII